MERSECREVLLVEWGAPARETKEARADCCLEARGRRKSCPVPEVTLLGWLHMRTGSPWLSSPKGCLCITPKVLTEEPSMPHFPEGAPAPSLVGCSAAPWDTQLGILAHSFPTAGVHSHDFHYSLWPPGKPKPTPQPAHPLSSLNFTFLCVPGRKSSHAGDTGREREITWRVSKKQAGEKMSVRQGWQVEAPFSTSSKLLWLSPET